MVTFSGAIRIDIDKGGRTFSSAEAKECLKNGLVMERTIDFYVHTFE
jgi:hypothetical protein